MTRAETSSPIAVLAFANLVAAGEPLPSLGDEADRLGELFADAPVQTHAIERASLAKVVDALQTHRNRVLIFHYAGHAGDAMWALADDDGDGDDDWINASELAAAFATSPPPRLVFLNGCATEPQVQAFLDAGVRSVIGTTVKIQDEVAAQFASRFYAGLLGGDTIAGAFAVATHEARARSQGTPRSILKPMRPQAVAAGGVAVEDAIEDAIEDADEIAEHGWPWQLHPAGSDAHDWRLAEAIDDPLYEFPLPADCRARYPREPYPHLMWYRREDAAIFFGRSREIRELADEILGDSAGVVIPFCGESGVGKSSLLEAGLQPRMQPHADVRIRRREAGCGLVAALRSALGARVGEPCPDAWERAERESGRPVVVVIDQAEEVFTQPLPTEPTGRSLEGPDERGDERDGERHGERNEEFATFCEAVQEAADAARLANDLDVDGSFRRRVVLSFRKEWLSEIEDALQDGGVLTTRRCTIRSLGRRGVTEAILGPVERTDGHYRLQVADDFVEQVRSDLCSDPDTPVAPVLQILLHNVYHRAVDRNADRPTLEWTEADARTGGANALATHLDESLVEIAAAGAQPSLAALRPALKAGLALDVLMQHVTADDTSEQVALADLNARYAHLGASVYPLLQLAAERHLLTFVVDKGDAPQTRTRLIHDTLAGIVARRAVNSNSRGRIARRILDNAFEGLPPGPLERSELPPAMTLHQYVQLRRGRLGTRTLDRRERDWVGKSVRVGAILGAIGLFLLIAIPWGFVAQNRRQQAEADKRLVAAVPIKNAATLRVALDEVAPRHRDDLRGYLHDPESDEFDDSDEARLTAFNAAVLLAEIGEAHPKSLLRATMLLPSEKLPLLAEAIAACDRIDRERTAAALSLITGEPRLDLLGIRSSAMPDPSEDWAPQDQPADASVKPRLAALLVLLEAEGVPLDWPVDWFGHDGDANGRTELQLRLAGELADASRAIESAGSEFVYGLHTVPVVLPESVPDVVFLTALLGGVTHDRVGWHLPTTPIDPLSGERPYSADIDARLSGLLRHDDAFLRSLAAYVDDWLGGRPRATERPDRGRRTDRLTVRRLVRDRWARFEVTAETAETGGTNRATSAAYSPWGWELRKIVPDERDFLVRDEARLRFEPRLQAMHSLEATHSMRTVRAVRAFEPVAVKPDPAPQAPPPPAPIVPSLAELSLIGEPSQYERRPALATHPSFWMASTETTAALLALYRNRARNVPRSTGGGAYGWQPARGVTFEEALSFCNWLTDLTYPAADGGPSPERVYDETTWTTRPDRRGFRLPTMAEWELAARAASTGRYSFGNVGRRIHLYGNVGEDSSDPTPRTVVPVGTTIPNAYGLFEMHGNVREWVWPDGAADESDESDESDTAETVRPVEAVDVDGRQWLKDSSFRLGMADWALEDFGPNGYATPVYGTHNDIDVGFRIATSHLGDSTDDD